MTIICIGGPKHGAEFPLVHRIADGDKPLEPSPYAMRPIHRVVNGVAETRLFMVALAESRPPLA